MVPNSTAYDTELPILPEAPEVVQAEEIVPRETVNKIDILVNVIEEFEGFYAGSRAYENNNPCNLRYSSRQSGKVAGFAYFDTYAEGREACVHQITIAADGRSRVYSPEMTLLQFFNIYAPSGDGNQPSVYYTYVINHTEFGPETRLKDLLK